MKRDRTTVPFAAALALLNLPVLWFASRWVSVPEHRAVPDGQAVEVSAQSGLPYLPLMGFVFVALIATIILRAKGLHRAAAWSVMLQIVPLAIAYLANY